MFAANSMTYARKRKAEKAAARKAFARSEAREEKKEKAEREALEMAEGSDQPEELYNVCTNGGRPRRHRKDIQTSD